MGHRPADDALAELARTRGRDLTAYAYVMTGDLAAAQDLVQEALLKVFVRTRTGYAPDVAEAYVRRTITTLYIDGYRHRRHARSVSHLVRPAESHEPMADADRRLDMLNALAALTRQERAAVVLHYYEGLSIAEAAAHLDLGDGTVKRYLSNARAKLEQRLGPLPDAESQPVHVPAAPEARRGRTS